FTASFTVPAGTATGVKRLRATAKMSSDAGHTIPTSCDMPMDAIGYHGEMEDYFVKIIVPNAITEADLKSSASAVYPNPAKGSVTVTFDAIENEPATIDLFDITGKLIGNLLNTQSRSA